MTCCGIDKRSGKECTRKEKHKTPRGLVLCDDHFKTLKTGDAVSTRANNSYTEDVLCRAWTLKLTRCTAAAKDGGQFCGRHVKGTHPTSYEEAQEKVTGKKAVCQEQGCSDKTDYGSPRCQKHMTKEDKKTKAQLQKEVDELAARLEQANSSMSTDNGSVASFESDDSTVGVKRRRR